MTAVTATEAPPAPDERRARRRAREITGQAGWAVLGWVAGIAFFLPVLWMVIRVYRKPWRGCGCIA